METQQPHRGPGHPRNPFKRKGRVLLYLTPEEQQIIKALAKSKGISMNEFLRRSALSQYVVKAGAETTPT